MTATLQLDKRNFKGAGIVPEISVIMTVFNAGDGLDLRLAIESILSQTFDDFELLVCDDGSTDSTFKTLLDLRETDERIRIFRNQSNMKAAYGRNRCISESTGRYVAIMDADDYSHKDRLKQQWEFLEQHPQCDFVGASADLYDHSGLWGHRSYIEVPRAEDFLFVLPFVHASMMFRKTSIESVGNYDSSRNVVRSEDYDLLMRLYAFGKQGVNLQETLYYIKEDEASLRRRRYRYRLNEAIVRYRGFKALGLMPRGFIYVFKPLVVGLLPRLILKQLKTIYYGKGRVKV